MNALRKMLWMAVAVSLVIVVIAGVAPRAAQAVVAALVRDVDNPGRATIVPVGCQAISTSGFRGAFECTPAYTVPSGQRLVIEQVEAICETPATNNVSSGFITISEQGIIAGKPVIFSPQGVDAFGVSIFAANQVVRYYADPGTTIRFDAVETDGTGSTLCSWSANGYLISYP